MEQGFSSITRGSAIRQGGTLPNVLAQAETPQDSQSAAYEGVEGGTATAWAVVLTALDVEHRAVEAHLKPFGQQQKLSEAIHPTTKTIYTQGRFETPNCVWNVAIAQIDMGNASAATEAERAIEKFKPRVMLFVGVAGGIKDVAIGDVVAASIVYGYDCGKQLKDETLPRPKLGEADYDLKQRAQAEARKGDWRSRILPGLSASERQPDVYIKPIAAGEKVVASRKSAVYKYLRRYYDDAIAVEMEGFGFLKATQQTKSVSAIVIRGISDLIEGKNDDAEESEAICQDRAARHASAFAFELLAKLDGDFGSELEQVEQLEEETITIDLNQKPPSAIAILHFQQLENSYRLRAHHCSMDMLEEQTTTMTVPISLGQFGKTYDWDLETVGTLYNYPSKRGPKCMMRKLMLWIQDLQRKDPTFSCLLIDEPPDSIIPWELLNLGNRPLGVLLQTVRSCFAIETSLSEMETQCIQTESYSCNGSVIIYEPKTAQVPTIQMFPKMQIYEPTIHCHDLPEEALAHLKNETGEFGLIFMADLALHHVSKGRRTFFLRETTLLQRAASVVMLHLTTAEEDIASQREMATTLVDFGAQGVLGMVETIDQSVSSKIINRFFEKYNEHQGKSIPEILRLLRDDIAIKLASATQQDDLDDLAHLYLATFMYAYYGHPNTVLNLTPASP